MTRIGYARVSTTDQHPEVQAERLGAAGCTRIYQDTGVSGAKASRPEWDKCLERLEPGDTLVAVRLDRIGRSVQNLIDVFETLRQRGVDVVILDQAIDTTTPAGKLMFHVIAAIAEFERDLIRERTRDGLKTARERGRKGGRKPKLTPAQATLVRRMYDACDADGRKQYTVAEIAGMVKVSRGTVYEYLRRTAQAA